MRMLTSLVIACVGMLVGCSGESKPHAPIKSEAVTPTADVASNPAQEEGPAPSGGKVQMTEEQWKAKLTPMQYHVLREKGTERAFSGKYFETKTKGVYKCAACAEELFVSDSKFDSGCGWPSFFEPVGGTKSPRILEAKDESFGATRTEVMCANCGGHLGHVFNDAPDQPTGLRYCINSASIELVPAEATKK
jgi:peptide-methionine (R)-S-oxide reductase